MQVIILLAGQGKRMGDLTKDNHKSLLPISPQETFLSKMLHQLNEYPLDRVIIVTGYKNELIEQECAKFQLNFEIVHNEKYNEDTNIYSMHLALTKAKNDVPTVILEGDILLEDLALKQIIESSKNNKSIWFTKGRFEAPMYGGILHHNGEEQNIDDIKIVPQFEDTYADYDKLLGIMTIGASELDTFKTLVAEYIKKTIDQYYLIPWIENLKVLPCVSESLEEFKVDSVNRPEEYQELYDSLNNNDNVKDLVMVEVATLKEIEGYISERKDMLVDKITKEKIWVKPIIIEENGLILDGHHRFAVAKHLGLTKIPAVRVNYYDLKVWSLREEEKVDHDTVIERALKGEIYPNKTVKHDFNFILPECKIPLEELY